MDYLILDYSDGTKDGKNKPKLEVVNEKELWEKVQAAYEEDEIKISVYKIGECLIDFS